MKGSRITFPSSPPEMPDIYKLRRLPEKSFQTAPTVKSSRSRKIEYCELTDFFLRRHFRMLESSYYWCARVVSTYGRGQYTLLTERANFENMYTYTALYNNIMTERKLCGILLQRTRTGKVSSRE